MVASDGCSDSQSNLMNDQRVTSVPFATEDRQWDARFNVQLDRDLEQLLETLRQDFGTGRLKYLLVGGVEVGTKPYQDDYQINHVHVAAMFANRVSKRSLLNTWNIKQGNGYYLVPRNRNLPYSGWKNHHCKEFSKIDPSKRVLLEMGNLPKDHAIQGETFVKRSDEEKKRKIDDVLIDMREMIENENEKEAWTKYPRTYLQYGEKIKALLMQKRDKLQSTGDPHMWLYGAPGIGKSAVLNYIYPKYYKKNLYNKFFDLYDPQMHTHVMLEDLDHDTVDKLSVNFVKTLCDEAGFAIDQKYKTPQLTRATILVTSNFKIDEVITHSDETNHNSRSQNVAALYRRFYHIEIKQLLQLLGLKLLPNYEVQQLKKEGNTDPGRLFITWDYVADMPVCQPIQSPEFYATLIKDSYYK
jgi:hypothetical protein